MIYKEWGIILEGLRLLRQEKLDEKNTLQIRADELRRWIEVGDAEALNEYKREFDETGQKIQKLSKDIVSINNIVAKIHCMNFS